MQVWNVVRSSQCSKLGFSVEEQEMGQDVVNEKNQL